MSKSTNFLVTELAVAGNGEYSANFSVPGWVMFHGLLLPAMDDGNIGIEISDDGGTTFYPLLDPADGADLVVCASGSDPGIIDISDYLRFMPDNNLWVARITCASQTSGPVTLKLIQRG